MAFTLHRQNQRTQVSIDCEEIEVFLKHKQHATVPELSYTNIVVLEPESCGTWLHYDYLCQKLLLCLR